MCFREVLIEKQWNVHESKPSEEFLGQILPWWVFGDSSHFYPIACASDPFSEWFCFATYFLAWCVVSVWALKQWNKWIMGGNLQDKAKINLFYLQTDYLGYLFQ